LYYQNADVHMLPSINSNEAFGLVTLEAMACGIPSIVSKLPGVKTLVIPGKTGWHVAPHVVEDLRRAMQEAIDDPNARWRYGQAARQRAVATYAAKDLAQRLLTVYEGK
jgi:glycosyltransferase involved in cell wall biosynthesis